MPRLEKKLRKSTTGPWRLWVREPTHSTDTTDLPARSAACWIVSAWRIEAPRLVRLLKLASPVRWKVLFVDPCSPGPVPDARVYHPTPVLGGKACVRPFSPFTPAAYIASYVGIAPSSTNRSTRSGRMPSEAKKIALSVLGLGA